MAASKVQYPKTSSGSLAERELGHLVDRTSRDVSAGNIA